MPVKTLLKKIFGDRHEREAKRLQPLIDQINELAEGLQDVSEDALRGKTEEFRTRLTERTEALEARIEELRETKR
ncbi:MAG TPA: hypothetical protein VLL48_11715, partial [Longimicrobiales bacterium]|nr:hypothetical protein [Longimicrobiales bacterium]